MCVTIDGNTRPVTLTAIAASPAPRRLVPFTATGGDLLRRDQQSRDHQRGDSRERLREHPNIVAKTGQDAFAQSVFE